MTRALTRTHDQQWEADMLTTKPTPRGIRLNDLSIHVPLPLVSSLRFACASLDVRAARVAADAPDRFGRNRDNSVSLMVLAVPSSLRCKITRGFIGSTTISLSLGIKNNWTYYWLFLTLFLGRKSFLTNKFRVRSKPKSHATRFNYIFFQFPKANKGREYSSQTNKSTIYNSRMGIIYLSFHFPWLTWFFPYLNLSA